jgi:Spy/CpxP family protein refolding chaperone
MRKTLFAALAATSLIAGAAVAADPPPPPPGMDAAQSAASRADDMALLLGLRPDQRPALDDFLGKIAPPADGERHGPPDGSWMQARMAAMQDYRATLAPDQQARFDALERLRRGGGRMGGGHGHWGGHGGGPE